MQRGKPHCYTYPNLRYFNIKRCGGCGVGGVIKIQPCLKDSYALYTKQIRVDKTKMLISYLIYKDQSFVCSLEILKVKALTSNKYGLIISNYL